MHFVQRHLNGLAPENFVELYVWFVYIFALSFSFYFNADTFTVGLMVCTVVCSKGVVSFRSL